MTFDQLKLEPTMPFGRSRDRTYLCRQIYGLAICPMFSRGLHLFPSVKIRHFRGFLEVVEILVDAGAIVDLQNRDGSLLHVAAGRSSYQVVNP